MKEELFKMIESKSPGAKPLFLVLRGSHAYGTNIETSDMDYSGVFIQSLDDILGSGYVEQINDDKNDIVIYEIKRFIELLSKNNPTVLELLNTPEDCIVYKDPLFDLVLDHSEKFITKICAGSFGGYAKTQINKAKGQNKKQNWEKDKVTRKDLLDFCYVISEGRSIPWKKWNDAWGGYDEKFIGASNIQFAHNLYSLFYDSDASNCFSESVPIHIREEEKRKLQESGSALGFGYKGLVKVGESDNLGISNQLRLSSIPKDQTPICIISYNKDGYSEHCKDFREYEQWLEKRNLQRWIDVKSHDQKIDGKNMMHCVRLVRMAKEIAEGKGIVVRRDDAEYLISVRRGEVDLQTLIDNVESDIKIVDELFSNSDLPDKVDLSFVNDILIKIRKEFYGI